MTDKNREKWLNDAVNNGIRDLFADAGYALPDFYASVSIPTASSKGASHVLGACYYNGPDGLCQIMISPTIEDGVRALDVLVHELVHAVCGADASHGPKFKKCALAVGLKGGRYNGAQESMRATEAGPDLVTKLTSIIDKIGAYPHPGLDLTKRKKQGTRQRKLKCVECGFQVYTSAKQIDYADQFGGLKCPCCNVAMVEPAPKFFLK